MVKCQYFLLHCHIKHFDLLNVSKSNSLLQSMEYQVRIWESIIFLFVWCLSLLIDMWFSFSICNNAVREQIFFFSHMDTLVYRCNNFVMFMEVHACNYKYSHLICVSLLNDPWIVNGFLIFSPQLSHTWKTMILTRQIRNR